ncbi:hypothetical protein NA57DRAFT_35236 [Rhizodiscina lignyota]|uniref:rRNA-processing protein EFG1 n=1 Tax=Rhizodiscina lignyota TaxID=1504668 RepID=A0A9P4IKU1_9PEZI|nr:hypothetical protein NA57DRAFT_35236 [Rhizodiscina lignyota]
MPTATRARAKLSGGLQESELRFNTHQRRRKDGAFKAPARRPPLGNEFLTTPLKKKIRDLEKLLQKMTNLPAGVRLEKERELQAYQADLKVALAKQKQTQRAGQYQMIRFFDSQKAQRRLKRATKELENSNDPSQQEHLKHKLHVAEVDVNYTLYFPFSQRYSALYPTKQREEDGKTVGDDDATDAGVRGDAKVWAQIEETMKKGEKALESLRDEMVLDPNKKESQSLSLSHRPKPKVRNSAPAQGGVSLTDTSHQDGRDSVMEDGDAEGLDAGSESDFFE